MASTFPTSADVFKLIPTPTTTRTDLSDTFDDTLSTRLQQHSDAIAAVETWLLANLAALGEPTGVVKAFTGTAPPTNYLMCSGQFISRTTYANLFAVIGTGYGTGDGSTTFAIPNLCGSIIIGAGQGPGLANRVLATTGGEETHALTLPEEAFHTHTIPATTHTHAGTHSHVHTVTNAMNTTIQQVNTVGGGTFFVPAVITTSDANNINLTINNATIGAGTSGSIGSGTGHNNMQPFVVMNFIIRT